MRAGVVLASVLVALAGCTAPDAEGPCADTVEDTIQRVVDGDTLDAALCGRIRLALVDTPERGEPGFGEASAFTAGLCPVGSKALVDRDAGQPTDTTGTRIVAVLHCGGQNLNAELLRNGHAVILTEFCAVSEFADEPWAAEGCSSAR